MQLFLSCHWVFGTQVPLSWLCTCWDTQCFLCQKVSIYPNDKHTRTSHSEYSKHLHISNNLNMCQQAQRKDQTVKNTVFISSVLNYLVKCRTAPLPSVKIMVQPMKSACFCFYKIESPSHKLIGGTTSKMFSMTLCNTNLSHIKGNL